MTEANKLSSRDLTLKAKALPFEKRKNVICSFKEVELHPYLKCLFEAMDSNAYVEITHGPTELGKDVVVVRNDNFGTTVIGVVVKCGNIKATTLGKVDEIKSQIDQAFQHPISLKSITKEVTINEVWVVIAGALSQQANLRIEREVQGKIRIFDMSWLIDNFTDYYPFIFFEGKIIDFIHEQLERLECNHMFYDKDVTLSDCFVDPLVAEDSFTQKLSLSTIKRKKLPFGTLESLLDKNNRIMLFGDPGTGKSIALHKIVIDKLNKAAELVIRGYKKPIGIPILVSAKVLINYGTSEELYNSFIPEEIRNKFFINGLMVDALDEIKMSIRNEIVDKAKVFADELNCSLIITSRKLPALKDPHIGFDAYELLPFEVSQAMKLFEKVLKNNEMLSVLKNGIDQVRYRMPLIPLSLRLLIELVESIGEVPASLTELYDRFCDIALGRYDKDKGIEVLFEYMVKKRFLAELAYKKFIIEIKDIEITYNDFIKFLDEYSLRYNWDQDDLTTFSYEIERAGILNIGEEFVSFKHRSFLDYFSALYIYENRENFVNLNQLIADNYFTGDGGEIAFFYIGLKRDIPQALMSILLEYPDDKHKYVVEKFTMGILLQAAWHTPTAIKLEGIQKTSVLAKTVRTEFLEFFNNLDSKVPPIIADCIVLGLSEYSLSSGFLYKEISQTINNLYSEPTTDNVYIVITMLKSIQRFLRDDELQTHINMCLKMISEVENMEIQDQVRMLMLLQLLETEDQGTHKAISNKLKRLSRRYPFIFKELLPKDRIG